MEQTMDEDMARVFECRKCGHFVCKDEAFEVKGDFGIKTCVCLECSTNRWKTMAEKYPDWNETKRYFHDIIFKFTGIIEILEEEGDDPKRIIPGLKAEIKQIEEEIQKREIKTPKEIPKPQEDDGMIQGHCIECNQSHRIHPEGYETCGCGGRIVPR